MLQNWRIFFCLHALFSAIFKVNETLCWGADLEGHSEYDPSPLGFAKHVICSILFIRIIVLLLKFRPTTRALPCIHLGWGVTILRSAENVNFILLFLVFDFYVVVPVSLLSCYSILTIVVSLKVTLREWKKIHRKKIKNGCTKSCWWWI